MGFISSIFRDSSNEKAVEITAANEVMTTFISENYFRQKEFFFKDEEVGKI